MWYLVFVGAILWLLVFYRMVTTMWAIGCFLYTLLLMALAFVCGAGLTIMFGGSLSDGRITHGLVDLITRSDAVLALAVFIPIAFLVDCFIWIVEMTFTAGSVFLWVTEALALWKGWEFTSNSWRIWHERMNELKQPSSNP